MMYYEVYCTVLYILVVGEVWVMDGGLGIIGDYWGWMVFGEEGGVEQQTRK